MAKTMVNRFAGACGSCGHTVGAGLGTVSNATGSWVAAHAAGGCLTVPVPVAAPRVQAPAPAEGFYLVDDLTVVKVYLTKKGNPATKTLALPTNPGPGRKARWNYTGQRPFGLCTPDKVLTAATAGVFGLATGYCARCGLWLDRPESKAVGYGPVCAKALGVPHKYGKPVDLTALPAAKAADDDNAALADEWGELAAAG